MTARERVFHENKKSAARKTDPNQQMKTTISPKSYRLLFENTNPKEKAEDGTDCFSVI